MCLVHLQNTIQTVHVYKIILNIGPLSFLLATVFLVYAQKTIYSVNKQIFSKYRHVTQYQITNIKLLPYVSHVDILDFCIETLKVDAFYATCTCARINEIKFNKKHLGFMNLLRYILKYSKSILHTHVLLLYLNMKMKTHCESLFFVQCEFTVSNFKLKPLTQVLISFCN